MIAMSLNHSVTMSICHNITMSLGRVWVRGREPKACEKVSVCETARRERGERLRKRAMAEGVCDKSEHQAGYMRWATRMQRRRGKEGTSTTDPFSSLSHPSQTPIHAAQQGPGHASPRIDPHANHTSTLTPHHALTHHTQARTRDTGAAGGPGWGERS